MKKSAILGMVAAGLMWFFSIPGWGWMMVISLVVLVWCFFANRDMESDPFGIDDSDDEWIDELKDVIAADDAQSEPEAVPRKT